jgi:glycosyl transferase family 25
MKIFLINLDRSRDRLAAIQTELGQAKLNFERVSAIDGNELNDLELSVYNPLKNLSRGEVACFLSHRLCWKKIIDSDIPAALILEDDVRAIRDISAIEKIDYMPAAVDILKIELWNTPLVTSSNGFETCLGGIYKLRGTYLGAAAYIISKAGAEKILELTNIFDFTVDRFFDPNARCFKKISTYQLLPPLFIQHRFFLGENSSDSELHVEREKIKSSGISRFPRISKFQRFSYLCKRFFMTRTGLWKKTFPYSSFTEARTDLVAHSRTDFPAKIR